MTLVYNFYYTSNEVIKHLIYKKTKKKQKTDYFTKFEVPQIISTKKNYKCVHCVNLSVNLFDDTVKGICTVQTVNKFLT